MDNKDALNTLQEIKDLMARSSRFQTISGWSIVLIGIYASIVSLGAWLMFGNHLPYTWMPESIQGFTINTPSHTINALIAAAVLVVVSFTTVSPVRILFRKGVISILDNFELRTFQ